MFADGCKVFQFVIDEFAGDLPEDFRSERIEGEDPVIEFAEPGDEFRHSELIVESLNGGGHFTLHAQMPVSLKDLRADIRGEEEEKAGNIVGFIVPERDPSGVDLLEHVFCDFRICLLELIVENRALPILFQKLVEPTGFPVRTAEKFSADVFSRCISEFGHIDPEKFFRAAEKVFDQLADNLGFSCSGASQEEEYGGPIRGVDGEKPVSQFLGDRVNDMILSHDPGLEVRFEAVEKFGG